MKPRRLPTRFISSEAGIVARARPTTITETGSVESAGMGANSAPTSPPISSTIGAPDNPSAWAKLKIVTLRMRMRIKLGSELADQLRLLGSELPG